jgi:hypothetical protein
VARVSSPPLPLLEAEPGGLANLFVAALLGIIFSVEIGHEILTDSNSEQQLGKQIKNCRLDLLL